MAAWPGLPEEIRQAIVTMAKFLNEEGSNKRS
jgi:hypothetical protein